MSDLPNVTADQQIVAVLNQLWHRSLGKPGGKSDFADEILDLYKLGREHRFIVNAYVFKDMKTALVEYVAKHGEVAK